MPVPAGRPRRRGAGGSGSPKTGRRFDVTPLLAMFVDLNVAAETFGVARRTVHRWKAEGVDEAHADMICQRLNVHPARVFGYEAWMESLSDAFDPDRPTLFDDTDLII